MRSVLISLGMIFLCVSSLRAEETAMDKVTARVSSEALKADVKLLAIPVRAKSILAKGTINALEKPASEMPPVWTAVIFRVERVLRGTFKTPKEQELTLMDQMKEAADDKKILKLLTMDFEKPPEEGTDKGWLSMAVVDPYVSFGIREGETPIALQRYKLSLARVHKDPESYVLVKSEKA